MKVRRSDRCGGHPCLDSGCKESYTGCSVNARHRYLISIFSRTRNDVRHVYCIHHHWAVYSKEDSAIFFLAPVSQRHLDERRERPAQTYGWKVSMLPNIFVEIPRSSLMAALFFLSGTTRLGFYKSAFHVRRFVAFLIVRTSYCSFDRYFPLHSHIPRP
jgi:hypothetical protein